MTSVDVIPPTNSTTMSREDFLVEIHDISISLEVEVRRQAYGGMKCGKVRYHTHWNHFAVLLCIRLESSFGYYDASAESKLNRPRFFCSATVTLNYLSHVSSSYTLGSHAKRRREERTPQKCLSNIFTCLGLFHTLYNATLCFTARRGHPFPTFESSSHHLNNCVKLASASTNAAHGSHSYLQVMVYSKVPALSGPKIQVSLALIRFDQDHYLKARSQISCRCL
jgi:hypothetical protein